MACKIEWKWNIPNALSLLRLVLVPVFVWCYLKGIGQPTWQYWAFGVLALSGLTDCVDGYIARRFDQITDLGKILDPVADKLTQMAVLVCLAMQYKDLFPLLVICVCKEVGQGIGGAIMLWKGAKMEGAKWYGKVTTIVFYLVMASYVIWPQMPRLLMLGLGGLVAALMLFAFVQYAIVFVRIAKKLNVTPCAKEIKE